MANTVLGPGGVQLPGQEAPEDRYARLRRMILGPEAAGTATAGVPNLAARPAPAPASETAGAMPTLQMPDMTAATDAAFAHAKDVQGQVTRGSMTGLQSLLAGSGQVGSGVGAKMGASVLNQGAASLGDTARQQAVTSADTATKNATTQYNAQVVMRGQDLQAKQEKARLQQQQLEQLMKAMGTSAGAF